jgi:hypothetical protein
MVPEEAPNSWSNELKVNVFNSLTLKSTNKNTNKSEFDVLRHLHFANGSTCDAAPHDWSRIAEADRGEECHS